VSKPKWHLQRRRVVRLIPASLNTDTVQPPLGSRYTLWARPAVWYGMGGNERSPEAGCVMTHAQFRQRLERWERLLQSPTIVAVILIGQDEPEPPHTPNVEVMQMTLGDPSAQAERGR